MNTADRVLIKQGDIVEFLPEFAEPGEDRFVFEALEDESRGRVLIAAHGVLQCFTPTQVVESCMLSRKG